MKQYTAEFKAEAVALAEKWVSDITYLGTTNGWVYLTVVLDLFDRNVLGWSLSDTMESAHTSIVALEMAMKNRQSAGITTSN